MDSKYNTDLVQTQSPMSAMQQSATSLNPSYNPLTWMGVMGKPKAAQLQKQASVVVRKQRYHFEQTAVKEETPVPLEQSRIAPCGEQMAALQKELQQLHIDGAHMKGPIIIAPPCGHH